MTWTDPTTVHVPAPLTVPPAAWGQVVNDDLNSLAGTWVTPALGSGWSGTVRYRWVGVVVAIDGVATSTTGASTLFTIAGWPAGFSFAAPIVGPAGIGEIAVDGSGNVTASGAGFGTYDLNALATSTI